MVNSVNLVKVVNMAHLAWLDRLDTSSISRMLPPLSRSAGGEAAISRLLLVERRGRYQPAVVERWKGKVSCPRLKRGICIYILHVCVCSKDGVSGSELYREKPAT